MRHVRRQVEVHVRKGLEDGELAALRIDARQAQPVGRKLKGQLQRSRS